MLYFSIIVFYLFAVAEAISEHYQQNKNIDIRDYQEKLRIFINLFKPLYNDTPLDKSEILVNLCFPVQRSQNITWRNGKTWKKCFDHVHIFRIPCLFVIMNCKLLIDFIGTLKKASVID